MLREGIGSKEEPSFSPRCISQKNVALARFHLTLLGKRKLKTWTPEHPLGTVGTHREKIPQTCHQLTAYKSQARHRATSLQLAVLWNSNTALNTIHIESSLPRSIQAWHLWSTSGHTAPAGYSQARVHRKGDGPRSICAPRSPCPSPTPR